MPRLFLADDNLTTQKVFQIALESEGFQVRSFDSGEALLAGLREEDAGLVALNISLSDYDGYELCRAVTSDSRTAEIPVILLVGAFQEYDESRAREAGCRGHLLKPFETAELASLVRQVTAEPVSRKTAVREVKGQSKSDGTVFQIPIEPATAETAFTLSSKQYRPRLIQLGAEEVKAVAEAPVPEPFDPAVQEEATEPAPTIRLHTKDIDLIVERLLERLPEEIIRVIKKLGSVS